MYLFRDSDTDLQCSCEKLLDTVFSRAANRSSLALELALDMTMIGNEAESLVISTLATCLKGSQEEGVDLDPQSWHLHCY
jgi:hypothetical protein